MTCPRPTPLTQPPGSKPKPLAPASGFLLVCQPEKSYLNKTQKPNYNFETVDDNSPDPLINTDTEYQKYTSNNDEEMVERPENNAFNEQQDDRDEFAQELFYRDDRNDNYAPERFSAVRGNEENVREVARNRRRLQDERERGDRFSAFNRQY